MKINLLWTAVIAELKFIKSSMKTEMMRVTEIVKTTVMILTSEKWLLKTVIILSLTDAALTAATVWDWWYLSCCNSLLILIKTWTYL